MPELKDFPAKCIYEPWKAPVADQKKAGCLVRGDGSGEVEEGGLKVYPKPMFDFNERRTVCIEAMKNAYRVRLHGNDPRVLNGAWRALFPDSAEGPTEGTNAEDAATSEGRRRRVRKDVDMGVDEGASGAADEGGDNKGGDASGNKRKRAREKGQKTIDGLFAPKKKAKR